MTNRKEHAWEKHIDALLGIAASTLLFGMMLLTFAAAPLRSPNSRCWC